MEKTQKIQVLYLDHAALVDHFVMIAGGGRKKENIEFCFIETDEQWVDHLKGIREGRLEYDVVILHYSFAGLDSRKLAKEIREFLPRARLGIKTGILTPSFGKEKDLKTLLLEAEPDFCFSPRREDLPFMFSEIEKGRINREDEQFRGYMVNTPEGYFSREPEIRRERE